MRRKVVLDVVGCKPPGSAQSVGGKHVIDLRLRPLFHHGYIDAHGRPPAKGTNPWFVEYSNLLADDEFLRFTPPGIAVDDHRESDSHRLGRAFARGFMAQHHGFRWFTSVKGLVEATHGAWSVQKRAKGNLPDWLATRKGKAVIAEAKGTHRSVHQGSTVLARSWRPQVQNVLVLRNGKLRGLDTWIVATRWVTTEQPRTPPTMYVEDPPLEGDGPTERDLDELNLTAARLHTRRNLLRLGDPALAERLLGVSAAGAETRAFRQLWTCEVPGLDREAFLGRFYLRDVPADAVLPWMLLHQPPPHEEWFRRYMLSVLFDYAVFDGIALSVVKPLLRNEMPPESDVHVPDDSAASYLSDGSLVASASLMAPANVVSI